MRILQITDLHVGEEGEDTYGVDVRRNFLHILREVEQAQPDHLVVTGDLCYTKGSATVYQWLREQFSKLDFPVSYIPGNHDDPALLAKLFELENDLLDGSLCYEVPAGDHFLLFLDTASAVLSEHQQEWLKDRLEQRGSAAVIFMHHPPGQIGVPFMDINYPLTNPGEVQALFQQAKGYWNVFCGHYHVEKTIQFPNMSVFVTPSCYFQLDQSSPGFGVDHYRIALREIDLHKTGLRTTVRYYDGYRL